MGGLTLYDKLWREHCIVQRDDGITLLYIDRHLIHEVTSPQAFAGLREQGRQPWRTAVAFAVPDHAIPTEVQQRLGGIDGIVDEVSRLQVQTLADNCEDFGISRLTLNDPRQGIVHVTGPEQGLTLPGMTVVCGDSHTSTHGAFAALAFGIGTSDVEHVLATGCLAAGKMKNMKIVLDGELPDQVTAKDMVLAVIGRVGTAGGRGYTIEFCGSAVRALTMEGRMTLCNMAIEAGARSALVAVDDVTINYLHGRPGAPAGQQWLQAEPLWRKLYSDADARFDSEVEFDVSTLEPQVTWGNMPDMVLPVSGTIPDVDGFFDADRRRSVTRALEYMDLQPGTRIIDIQLDRVFIGSCTNSRIEDLRQAAAVVRGRKKASGVKQVMVVPGSGLVKAAAEQEGLHRIFIDAGFEWREPGCSMCLAMNDDRLLPGERCASTSNRNFEGRQGHGGRTHLVSPAMAAAAAVTGHFVDIRNWPRAAA